ncbi:MotA/TolQ/ExbB proton channel family protein [Phenylobacterium sp.]|uniref:MotA/TolQ/ExbB proton channel family protein n=1 Tax=Phenylobacterium sp. TaxID=1871053 RepID=UPI00286C467F|nr:MotA/TolQ/ExbB proton channel family protein [Phenylobacterium sp.]
MSKPCLRSLMTFTLSLITTPALADVAAADPPLAVVPTAERLTGLAIFANAHPIVQVVFAGLVISTVAAVAIWIVQLARLRQRRSDGLAGAVAFLSALSAAGPMIGFFGAAYDLLDMFIGIANVRPAPSLSILAPGLAEAALSACLGLLAAAVAAIAHRHLKARLYGVELPAAVAS